MKWISNKLRNAIRAWLGIERLETEVACAQMNISTIEDALSDASDVRLGALETRMVMIDPRRAGPTLPISSLDSAFKGEG